VNSSIALELIFIRKFPTPLCFREWYILRYISDCLTRIAFSFLLIRPEGPVSPFRFPPQNFWPPISKLQGAPLEFPLCSPTSLRPPPWNPLSFSSHGLELFFALPLYFALQLEISELFRFIPSVFCPKTFLKSLRKPQHPCPDITNSSFFFPSIHLRPFSTFRLCLLLPRPSSPVRGEALDRYPLRSTP